MGLCIESSLVDLRREYHRDEFILVFCFCTCKRTIPTQEYLIALLFFARFKLSRKMRLNSEELTSWPWLLHKYHIWNLWPAKQLRSVPSRVSESRHTCWWGPIRYGMDDSRQFYSPRCLRLRYDITRWAPEPNLADSWAPSVGCRYWGGSLPHPHHQHLLTTHHLLLILPRHFPRPSNPSCCPTTPRLI